MEDKATPVIGPAVSSDRMTSKKGPRYKFASISDKSKGKKTLSKRLNHSRDTVN